MINYPYKVVEICNGQIVSNSYEYRSKTNAEKIAKEATKTAKQVFPRLRIKYKAKRVWFYGPNEKGEIVRKKL